MTTGRALAAGFKSIPFRSAAFVKVFRMIAIPAHPLIEFAGTPTADRTTYITDQLAQIRFFLSHAAIFLIGRRTPKLKGSAKKAQVVLHPTITPN